MDNNDYIIIIIIIIINNNNNILNNYHVKFLLNAMNASVFDDTVDQISWASSIRAFSLGDFITTSSLSQMSSSSSATFILLTVCC